MIIDIHPILGFGEHEHERNLEIGDELMFKVQRLTEKVEIEPTNKNIKALQKATLELIDHTKKMAEIYGLSD